MEIVKTHRYWRYFEIIPGAISWTALLLPILFSIFKPTYVAYFIISYTILWLFRSINLSKNLYRSFQKTKEAQKINWQKQLETAPQKDIAWENIFHAVLYVTYKEGLSVIESSIESYAHSTFPAKKIILVLAGEKKDQENFLKISESIKKKYEHSFFKILISIHPANLPGEIAGKSSNSTYAAKKLKEYIDQQGIPYEHVMVSNFDADTVADQQYFSELTYKYLHAENRTKKTYQPTHMYHNNIWDVPTIIRLIALSCTFWRMAESMNRKKFKSFSSRSLSLKTIVEINYWDTAVIPEDSRQYWTAYFTYDGKHELVPIYTPLYMDAVLADNYVNTFKNQYRQLRRWAWGVCDFPFVVINSIKNKNIPVLTRFSNIFFLLENHFCWATAPVLITFSGWLPGLLNPNFRETVLAYNLPIITSKVLTLTTIGILTCIIVSFRLIPKRPEGKTWLHSLSLIVQWGFTPVVSIFLSAIPALDAQTRLLFGKYLEYQVTPKSRRMERSHRAIKGLSDLSVSASQNRSPHPKILVGSEK